MKGQWDAIRVGRVTLRRAWLTPGNELEPNPVRAQLIAERENERLKHLNKELNIREMPGEKRFISHERESRS